ncbi:hypothetical protein [Winogradskyella aurantia]|uniref:Uncharacterized protein n=1 Tax=Winogradskyella aurantia TaxID=1915063 RepID=A0A265UWX9_9FLAO|nr:hypothetical protein [Winogradskyella aurantia]OZV69809.1 hypothetical protein CA834_04085 [Winogradskyella aurantia]
MKKIMILLVALAMTSCNNEKKESEQPESVKQDTTIVKPIESWDVQKEVDEFGNLIKYDSTYTWSYSNTKGDSIQVNLDSIMDSFKGYFGKNTPLNWNEDFSYFPEVDTLLKDNFFKKDYFFDQWKQNPMSIEKMLQQMDSTRNLFLKRFHPGLLESRDNIKIE